MFWPKGSTFDHDVFLSILGSCYTTLDAKLFEDAATLLPVYIVQECDTLVLTRSLMDFLS